MRTVALLASVFILSSCAAREPVNDVAYEAQAALPQVRLVELQPGPALPTAARDRDYSSSDEAIAEGKRLFSSFNCDGCHFNGGGGIGPPLMDEKWIYGSAPSNVFSSIVEGRPNGMPSYGGKIPEAQVWQLVAFIESLHTSQ